MLLRPQLLRWFPKRSDYFGSRAVKDDSEKWRRRGKSDSTGHGGWIKYLSWGFLVALKGTPEVFRASVEEILNIFLCPTGAPGLQGKEVALIWGLILCYPQEKSNLMENGRFLEGQILQDVSSKICQSSKKRNQCGPCIRGRGIWTNTHMRIIGNEEKEQERSWSGRLNRDLILLICTKCSWHAWLKTSTAQWTRYWCYFRFRVGETEDFWSRCLFQVTLLTSSEARNPTVWQQIQSSELLH